MGFFKKLFRLVKAFFDPLRKSSRELKKKTGASLSARQMREDLAKCAAKKAGKEREASYAATAVTWREGIAKDAARANAERAGKKPLDGNVDAHWQKLLQKVEEDARKNESRLLLRLKEKEKGATPPRKEPVVLPDMQRGFAKAQSEVEKLKKQQKKPPKQEKSAQERKEEEGQKGGKTAAPSMWPMYPAYFVPFLFWGAGKKPPAGASRTDLWNGYYLYFFALQKEEKKPTPAEKEEEAVNGKSANGGLQEKLSRDLKNPTVKNEVKNEAKEPLSQTVEKEGAPLDTSQTELSSLLQEENPLPSRESVEGQNLIQEPVEFDTAAFQEETPLPSRESVEGQNLIQEPVEFDTAAFQEENPLPSRESVEGQNLIQEPVEFDTAAFQEENPLPSRESVEGPLFQQPPTEEPPTLDAPVPRK